MPSISRRSSELGTENAFVVLAEVSELQRQGKDIVSFCIGRQVSSNCERQQLTT
jgi:hypothetical protein